MKRENPSSSPVARPRSRDREVARLRADASGFRWLEFAFDVMVLLVTGGWS
jgi:hypothetical protein